MKGQIILALKVYWYAKKKNVEKCGEAMMTLVLNEFLEFLVSLTKQSFLKNAQRPGPQPQLDPKILETASFCLGASHIHALLPCIFLWREQGGSW